MVVFSGLVSALCSLRIGPSASQAGSSSSELTALYAVIQRLEEQNALLRKQQDNSRTKETPVPSTSPPAEHKPVATPARGGGQLALPPLKTPSEKNRENDLAMTPPPKRSPSKAEPGEPSSANAAAEPQTTKPTPIIKINSSTHRKQYAKLATWLDVTWRLEGGSNNVYFGHIPFYLVLSLIGLPT